MRNRQLQADAVRAPSSVLPREPEQTHRRAAPHLERAVLDDGGAGPSLFAKRADDREHGVGMRRQRG